MATTLGDICKVDWGNTAITKKSYVENGKFLAVSATGGDGKLNHFEHEADVCVLSAIGAQCGKMFFPQQRFTAIKNTITLTPKADKVFSKFLYYLFTAIELPKRGAAQPFISKGDIQNFNVPFLPPLAEQKRIVTKLDAAFAEIDLAVEATEEIISKGESIIGKYINKLMKSDGEEVKISDLSLSITDGDHQPPPKCESGVPFITISNVNKLSRKIDFSNTFFVPQTYYDNLKEKRKPKRGDILYTVTGSFGIPVLIDDDSRFCFQRHIAIIRPKVSVNSEWLFYLLQSPLVYNQASKGANGTAQKTVSLKVLREIRVPKFEFQQQLLSAEKIRKIDFQIRRFKVLLDKKKRNLNSLKLSILKKELKSDF